MADCKKGTRLGVIKKFLEDLNEKDPKTLAEMWSRIETVFSTKIKEEDKELLGQNPGLILSSVMNHSKVQSDSKWGEKWATFVKCLTCGPHI